MQTIIGLLYFFKNLSLKLWYFFYQETMFTYKRLVGETNDHS